MPDSVSAVRDFGNCGVPCAPKRCTGCGVEKDATADFYAKRIGAHGQVILKSRCKTCTIEDVQDRRARDAGIPQVVIAKLGKFTRIDDDERAVPAVRVEEIAFVLTETPPRPEGVALPAFGTSPECWRGRHEWPIERVCRGYEALGCYGAGPHVHRRCPVHCVETTEAAPPGFLPRRQRTVYLERRGARA